MPDAISKTELLQKLRDTSPADNENDHYQAEGWLLDYIADEEISQAWLERRERVGWWYA